MVLNVEVPEGLTCPEESVTSYTVSSVKSESISSYLGVSSFKYAFDSGDYNNSVVSINSNLKTTSEASVGYCDFKSTVFSSVTVWNNVKLVGNVTFAYRTGS